MDTITSRFMDATGQVINELNVTEFREYVEQVRKEPLRRRFLLADLLDFSFGVGAYRPAAGRPRRWASLLDKGRVLVSYDLDETRRRIPCY